VSVDEELKNSFIQEPLKTTIYFKYDKDTVHATVEFNYKQLVLSTNVEENHLPDPGVQIIRDSQQEMKRIKSPERV